MSRNRPQPFTLARLALNNTTHPPPPHFKQFPIPLSLNLKGVMSLPFPQAPPPQTPPPHAYHIYQRLHRASDWKTFANGSIDKVQQFSVGITQEEIGCLGCVHHVAASHRHKAIKAGKCYGFLKAAATCTHVRAHTTHNSRDDSSQRIITHLSLVGSMETLSYTE